MEVRFEMAIVDGLHNFGVNVGHLNVGFKIVLPQERHQGFEFKQHVFLVNLEITLGLLQVVHFRNQEVASSRTHLELQLFQFWLYFLQRLRICDL